MDQEWTRLRYRESRTAYRVRALPACHIDRDEIRCNSISLLVEEHQTTFELATLNRERSTVPAQTSIENGQVAATKELIRRVATSSWTDAQAAAVAHLADTWERAEARAGIEAFVSKSIPPWKPVP